MKEYERDILLWSEHHAGLLRPMAAGELVNDQVDWENVIEEVESVGRSQLDAVESLLFQALVHMLKADAWPLSITAPSWRADARGFRAQARRRFTPSKILSGEGDIEMTQLRYADRRSSKSKLPG
ncbi:MAG: DUF29 domain-containing protein [Acetobacteraceae bacterium]|nr:DUF29 domain-containing protein [Acetobacteraceae bacterium]MBV8523351.1 DUF29 domain-containing protein [Acetobacteraceae bacterium]